MKVWLHQIAGRTLEVHCVAAADSGPIAFTDVTAASLYVQHPKAGEAIVTDVTLSGATSSAITLQVTFDDVAPEITRAGVHTIKARLTMTGTTVPEWTEPQELRVLGPYEVDNG